MALAPAEYVIVRKLEYYREGGSEKHLRDIRSMLAVSGDREHYHIAVLASTYSYTTYLGS